MHDDEQLTFEHLGHTVTIDPLDRGKGYWSWAYTIDGEKYVQSTDRPLQSRELAIKEARSDAEGKISKL